MIEHLPPWMHSSCNSSRDLTIFIVCLDEIKLNAFNPQGCTQCSWQTKCSCASSSQMMHICTSLQGLQPSAQTLVGSTKSLNGWLLYYCALSLTELKLKELSTTIDTAKVLGLFLFCCHVLPECPFRDTSMVDALEKITMIAASDCKDKFWWMTCNLLIGEFVDIEMLDGQWQ